MAFRSESHVAPGTGTSPTLTEPAGAASGDVMVALYICDSPGAPATLPAGWTTIVTDSSQNGFFGITIGYIVRGGSAPSYAFTHTGTVYRECFVLCYSGIDNTTPLDVTAPTPVKSTGATKPDPPAAGASVTANAIAVALANMWGNAPSGGWTAPASHTLRYGSTTGNTAAASDKLIASAGTNENPAVFGGTPQSNDDGWALTLLLRPTAGGDATVTAPVADSVGDVVTPAVSAGSGVTSPAGAGVGDIVTPSVSTSADSTVSAVPADGVADLATPSASASSDVAATPADATGAIPPANEQISEVVGSGPLSGGGGLVAPTVSGTVAASVDAPAADSSGDIQTPGISADSSVSAGPVDGSADVVSPVVQADASIGATPLAGSGDVPDVSLAGDQQVDAPVDDGSGDILVPGISAGATVSTTPATGAADMRAPVVTSTGRILPRIDLPTIVRLENYRPVVAIRAKTSSVGVLDSMSDVTARNPSPRLSIDG